MKYSFFMNWNWVISWSIAALAVAAKVLFSIVHINELSGVGFAYGRNSQVIRRLQRSRDKILDMVIHTPGYESWNTTWRWKWEINIAFCMSSTWDQTRDPGMWPIRNQTGVWDDAPFLARHNKLIIYIIIGKEIGYLEEFAEVSATERLHPNLIYFSNFHNAQHNIVLQMLRLTSSRAWSCHWKMAIALGNVFLNHLASRSGYVICSFQ